MTKVLVLMEGRAEASGLVLVDAQTGSAKIIAKYIKDGAGNTMNMDSIVGSSFFIYREFPNA